ncbi:MAG: MmcQ/YjbR family DNA-binding protein [Anaeroplasmataceae bacterium]|nr:MmcQ/YjbR family DNA-binding protein [Anaeroplasmataceae bacterium]
MSIESEVFKKRKFSKDKLLSYGFKKDNTIYSFSKEMSNGFIAVIEFNEQEILTGKIMDPSLDEDYTNFRVESLKGEFVNSIREEYKSILFDIAEHCCEKQYFITPQTNRIAKTIIETYHNEPEFLWESSPDCAIFRHPDNQKWYALIMYINKNKVDKKAFGMVEVLNLKIKEEELSELLNQDGFYEAYHMNKKKWITIVLDDTIPDVKVIEYIKKSHIYTS